MRLIPLNSSGGCRTVNKFESGKQEYLERIH